MRTLIFNGSPRQDGDTAALIAAFTSELVGDLDVVDCFASDISPCLDCRACETLFHCAIEDDMQAVYGLIDAADNIVIASPVWFSSLSGPTLDVLSRLQPCFYARRRGEIGLSGKPRRGGVLLACGGSGDPAPAVALAGRLLRAMNCRSVAPAVLSPRTDELPASRDGDALASARALAAWFNGEADC